MIINNIHFVGIPFSPDETDTILIVYPDTILSGTGTLQCFQTITRKDRYIREFNGCMNLYQFTFDYRRQSVVSSGASPFENQFGVFGSE